MSELTDELDFQFVVLVIDDQPEAFELLAQYNRLHGRGDLDILISDGGARALPSGLERLEQEPVALVVVDWEMPGGTGADVLAALQSVRFGGPVLVLTQHHNAEINSRALELGARFVLQKGPSLGSSRLLSHIQTLLAESVAEVRIRTRLIREIARIWMVARAWEALRPPLEAALGEAQCSPARAQLDDLVRSMRHFTRALTPSPRGRSRPIVRMASEVLVRLRSWLRILSWVDMAKVQAPPGAPMLAFASPEREDLLLASIEGLARGVALRSECGGRLDRVQVRVALHGEALVLDVEGRRLVESNSERPHQPLEPRIALFALTDILGCEVQAFAEGQTLGFPTSERVDALRPDRFVVTIPSAL